MAQKHRKTFAWFVAGIIIVLIASAGVLYALGWRIGSSGLISPGTLVVENIMSYGLLIVDGDEKTVTAETEHIRLASGVHTLIYAEPNMWPWARDVRIVPGENTIVAPFTVPQNTNGFTVGEPDDEYPAIVAAFGSPAPLPTQDSPAHSDDGTTSLFLSGSNVHMYWDDESDPPSAFCVTDTSCSDTVTVLAPLEPIRALTFYKGRNDVIIAATGNTIFALDNTVRDGQNFHPIYKGVAPTFRVKNDQELYVRDGEQYYIINY